jgi:hypothetical protein
MGESILKIWDISETELTEIVRSNPSLRGMMLGYVAEKKFHDLFLQHPGITEISKADDHDRSKKGDLRFLYKKSELVVEVKSLQTNSIRRKSSGEWFGKAQVDASDRRIVRLPNGGSVNTTCLLVGEFDLLAVNIFAFEEKWRFVFAKNAELPRTTWKGYKPRQRKHLLATLVDVTWPPKPPFYADPFPLLDDLARERLRA